MKKVLFILFTVLLFNPLNTMAKQCSSTDKNRLEKLANEIQTTFDYIELNNNINFSISFHNVYKDLYLMNYSDFDTIKKYRNTGGVIVANEYAANKTYNFSVLYDGSSCDSYIVKTIKVTTPTYNKYYSDPLCKGIETYSLCQKWNNIGNVSYEDFKTSVTDYKKQQESNTQITEPMIENNLWNQIRNFIANYYVYLLGGTVLILVVIYVIYNKRKSTKW